jgi:hypothetical protein
MEIILTIDTDDQQLVEELKEVQYPSNSNISQLPNILFRIRQQTANQRSFGFPVPLEFVLTFGSGVAAGIISNWLYDKLKGRTRRICINHIEVQLDKDNIEKILIEQIESNG